MTLGVGESLHDFQELQRVASGCLDRSGDARGRKMGMTNVTVQFDDGGMIYRVQADEGAYVTVADAGFGVECAIRQVAR